MGIRNIPLAVEGVYHIYNRGVENRTVFDGPSDYERFIALLEYQRVDGALIQFARFLEIHSESRSNLFAAIRALQSERGTGADILAYCLMPNQFHLILHQTKEGGISAFLQRLCNSYARYYNHKTRRSGPLWEGRFKAVLAEDDVQLQHLSRSIHLNPVTARLAERPEQWAYSSYREYTEPHGEKPDQPYLCRHRDFIDLKPAEYAQFVADHF